MDTTFQHHTVGKVDLKSWLFIQVIQSSNFAHNSILRFTSFLKINFI